MLQHVSCTPANKTCNSAVCNPSLDVFGKSSTSSGDVSPALGASDKPVKGKPSGGKKAAHRNKTVHPSKAGSLLKRTF